MKRGGQTRTEERDGEGNEGVGVRRRDLQRCDSLDPKQSSDDICLNHSVLLKRTFSWHHRFYRASLDVAAEKLCLQ